MIRRIFDRFRLYGRLLALKNYVALPPSPQNAVDIFRGEWSSSLPAAAGADTRGPIPLFQDARIKWLAESIGGLSGKTCLELGPLEGAHTWMLEQFGAASILGIEANTRAFLRCLIVKELLDMRKAHFVCGDFLQFLRATDTRFDICLASGVLYHMQNPAELIALLARRSVEHLFLWTHYFDAAVIERNAALAKHFSGSSHRTYEGFSHTLYRRDYRESLDWIGFCGAGTHESYWMTRDDVLRCLAHFGFEVEQIGFEASDHPHGPAFAVIARPKVRAGSSDPARYSS